MIKLHAGSMIQRVCDGNERNCFACCKAARCGRSQSLPYSSRVTSCLVTSIMTKILKRRSSIIIKFWRSRLQCFGTLCMHLHPFRFIIAIIVNDKSSYLLSREEKERLSALRVHVAWRSWNKAKGRTSHSKRFSFFLRDHQVSMTHQHRVKFAAINNEILFLFLLAPSQISDALMHDTDSLREVSFLACSNLFARARSLRGEEKW